MVVSRPSHLDTLQGPSSIRELRDGPGSPKKNSISQSEQVPVVIPEPPYTVFTTPHKIFISLVASFSGMFSTLCSYIYYPAIVSISRDLESSVRLINLTVTSYFVIAAVAPAFMGDLADRLGRRPIYILMFSFFIGANIGIALVQNFPGLLVLRMLQSAGSSGLLAVCYGVIADITTPENRGGYVGMFDLLINLAVSVGPVIGGLITQYLSWRWIFYFLLILTSSQFLLMILVFPETQRKIVGNGSARVSGVYWSLFTWIQRGITRTDPPERKASKSQWLPNPFACLKIFANIESTMVILLYSLTYNVKMSTQASLGSQCVDIYGLDYLTAGLVYLPSGVGGVFASFATGKYLDKVYLKDAKSFYGTDDIPGRHDYPPEFPIENIRLHGVFLFIVVAVLSTVGYGLALMTQAHVSVMILMQFFIGVSTSCIFTQSATLLTDLNKDRSATAQGANSLVRCLLAAAGVAALEPLADAAGLGWCFGIYAASLSIELLLVWLLKTRGVSWRTKKYSDR